MKPAAADRRGFTLVELLISLGLMTLVILALLTMVTTTQNFSLTEGRKLDMNQGGRVIEQMLCDGFRSAGSVLSLANTPTLLGTAAVPFNGIHPLNNTGYPDGIILAAGDPTTLTRLTAQYNTGETTLNVVTVAHADGTVAWQANDWGMLLRSDGYYVFRVDSAATPASGDTTLSVRAAPAYYSGLLNTAHYNDPSDEMLGAAGNGAYDAGCPVVRLDFFHMFLVRTEADGSLTLTLTSDCEGVADVLGNAITDHRAVPILPQVGDIQIEYLTEDAVPVVWAGSDPGQANPCPAGGEADPLCQSFYNQFHIKNVATARVYALLRTEEETNKRAGSGIVFSKPRMGDTAAVTLPVGRFHYNYMQYEVQLRNYANIY